MQIGLCTIAFRDLPLRDVIEIAKTADVDGIEIWGQAAHVGPDISPTDLEMVTHMIKRANLRVSAYGSYIRFADNGNEVNSESDFKKALTVTKALGTDIMRIWVGSKPSDDMNQQDWELATRSLAKACAEADKYGIYLAMEMHDSCFTDTETATLRLIDEVKANNLRVNYQPSFRLPPDRELKSLGAVGEFTINVHAQNRNRLASKPGERLELALLTEGVADYKAIVAELLSIDYSEFISIEFVKGPNRLGSLKQDIEYLRKCMQNHTDNTCDMK